MTIETPRDLWRTTWEILSSEPVIIGLLLGVSAGLLLTAWLPQTPNNDPVAYAQWLSDVQNRFGAATPTMQALGLFDVPSSLLFRTLVALLAGALTLRLVEAIDRLRRSRAAASPDDDWREAPPGLTSDVIEALNRQKWYRVLTDDETACIQIDRWPWPHAFSILLHGGALLLLAGLLVGHVGGWQTDRLIIQGTERIALPGANHWIALSGGSDPQVAHSRGVTPVVHQRGPGMTVQANDRAGDPLPIQQTVKSDPVSHLILPLIEDQYFAIPDAQLIVRLTTQTYEPNEIGKTGEIGEANGVNEENDADTPYAPIVVQAYRSPSGQLVAEHVVEGAEESAIPLEDVDLALTPTPYVQLSVTRNPGRWPTAMGIVILIIGILGQMTWPPHRTWIKETDERVELSGHDPPMAGAATIESASKDENLCPSA